MKTIMKNMFPGLLVWMTLMLAGCGGGGGSAGPDAKVTPTPLVALSSSYDYKNKNDVILDTSQIPLVAADTALWTQVPESLAFGDFFQEGKYSAFVAANQANGLAKAYFLKKNDAGTWTDATTDVLTDRSICTKVVQAISADFNGDGKPDVYVACGGSAGSMRQVFFMSKTGQIAYERQETTFSLQSWGAAAANIDGDTNGAIDLVVTDNDMTLAVMNDGLKNGANSFAKDLAGRVPTGGGGQSFPTLHRKVFLIPQANANPDLVIAGTGAGANSNAIYLKNDTVRKGYFFVSPSTGASAMFEAKLVNGVAVKFYDVVADSSQALYVLAKDVGVETSSSATEMIVLKYESSSAISGANSILNLQGGYNGVLALPSNPYSPTDGFLSQFKINAAGRLVAFDGACAVGSQRCAFDIAP